MKGYVLSVREIALTVFWLRVIVLVLRNWRRAIVLFPRIRAFRESERSKL